MRIRVSILVLVKLGLRVVNDAIKGKIPGAVSILVLVKLGLRGVNDGSGLYHWRSLNSCSGEARPEGLLGQRDDVTRFARLNSCSGEARPEGVGTSAGIEPARG